MWAEAVGPFKNAVPMAIWGDRRTNLLHSRYAILSGMADPLIVPTLVTHAVCKPSVYSEVMLAELYKFTLFIFPRDDELKQKGKHTLSSPCYFGGSSSRR